MDLVDLLTEQRVLAIVRGSSGPAAVQSACRLVDAGILVVEVSLTTPDALAAISEIRRHVDGSAVVGAGTVMSAADVRRVADAGAGFVVTPAVTEAVSAAVEAGLPVAAGALTPTEVVGAVAAGADVVKLFPASLGGPSYLAALRDPFPDVRFVPVGGVGLSVVADYLAAGAIAVGVGSPLVGDAASGGDLDALTARAAQLLAALDRP